VHRELLEILVDPVSRAPLALMEPSTTAEDVETGTLSGGSGAYEIRGGIPRLGAPSDAAQAQTADSFGYKWNRRETWDSPQFMEVGGAWLVSRYGFDDIAEMRRHFEGRDRFLDAGCGGGYSAALWTDGWDAAPSWVGVDISDAVDVARERLAHLPHADFVQADLLRLPFAEGSFDTVFAEGVLHHTPSTWDALAGLVRALRSGGEACFYVYRRKSAVREFTDDHVRGLISDLGHDEAWELLRPLTALGQSLAELKQEIDVPEDIEVLGIPAGRYDVQRLLYWHFAKLFWNEKLSFEENLHVNFDWYHPRYAHRQTEDELRAACERCGIDIVHLDAQESGFTVRAVKR
jgi:arsenite methyltransferase